MPVIELVLLFGSLATGIATPPSDADLLVVVRDSSLQPRDRIPKVLAALSPLPCSVDLFVLTTGEFERARADGLPLVRETLAHGRKLLPPFAGAPDDAR